MLNLIPVQYRMAVKFIVLLAALALSAFAGAKVMHWKMGESFGKERASLTTQIADLKSAVEYQSAAVEKSQSVAEIAMAARDKAVAEAAAASKKTATRIVRIKQISANSCDEAISAYWEMKK